MEAPIDQSGADRPEERDFTTDPWENVPTSDGDPRIERSKLGWGIGIGRRAWMRGGFEAEGSNSTAAVLGVCVLALAIVAAVVVPRLVVPATASTATHLGVAAIAGLLILIAGGVILVHLRPREPRKDRS